MMGAKPLAAQIDDGTAKIEGDRKVLNQLASTLVDFEIGFEILPGSKDADWFRAPNLVHSQYYKNDALISLIAKNLVR